MDVHGCRCACRQLGWRNFKDFTSLSTLALPHESLHNEIFDIYTPMSKASSTELAAHLRSDISNWTAGPLIHGRILLYSWVFSLSREAESVWQRTSFETVCRPGRITSSLGWLFMTSTSCICMFLCDPIWFSEAVKKQSTPLRGYKQVKIRLKKDPPRLEIEYKKHLVCGCVFANVSAGKHMARIPVLPLMF